MRFSTVHVAAVLQLISLAAATPRAFDAGRSDLGQDHPLVKKQTQAMCDFCCSNHLNYCDECNCAVSFFF